MLLGLTGLHWLPDVLAIVVVFWNVHQPRRVGVGAAFLFGGILMAAGAGFAAFSGFDFYDAVMTIHFQLFLLSVLNFLLYRF